MLVIFIFDRENLKDMIKQNAHTLNFLFDQCFMCGLKVEFEYYALTLH